MLELRDSVVECGSPMPLLWLDSAHTLLLLLIGVWVLLTSAATTKMDSKSATLIQLRQARLYEIRQVFLLLNGWKKPGVIGDSYRIEFQRTE